jgi:ABC-type glycerol-3-phosphate transport system permease component
MRADTLTKEPISPASTPVVYQARKKKITVQQILAEVVKYTLLVVLAISFLLPLYWMGMSALKTQEQVFMIPPVWLPNPARWANYVEAWQVDDFTKYLFNTVFRYAIPVVFGTVLSNTLVAYSFGRLKWPGRDILFSICLMTMMIPYQVTMVPVFIIFKHLGWVNTYNPLVIPAFFASPYTIFMLRQFFRTIPEELSDASRIDGANEFQTLWYIVMPLVKPALAVVALFTFMSAWNDYMGPLIYINQSEMYPISLGLANLSTALSQVGIKGLAYPYLMAVSTLVTIPIILIFFFTQRTFIEGIALTGMKG